MRNILIDNIYKISVELRTYSGTYPFRIPGLQSAAERANNASF